MTWSPRRRAQLPSNWNSIRARILKRDPQCQLAYDCCTGTSTEVDHRGQPTDHRDVMLRGVCHPCHQIRTQAQALRARMQKQRRRKAPKHPGDAA